MRHTKALLSLLLTLALAFSLALPALADEPDPAMPVIAKQPQSVTVKSGESFTLTVEAEIASGGEIGYQWYDACDDRRLPAANNPYIISSDNTFPNGASLYCVVYNKATSTYESGPHRVVSETATVTVLASPDTIVIDLDSFGGKLLNTLFLPFAGVAKVLRFFGLSTDAINVIANIITFPFTVLSWPVFWMILLFG